MHPTHQIRFWHITNYWNWGVHCISTWTCNKCIIYKLLIRILLFKKRQKNKKKCPILMRFILFVIFHKWFCHHPWKVLIYFFFFFFFGTRPLFNFHACFLKVYPAASFFPKTCVGEMCPLRKIQSCTHQSILKILFKESDRRF